MADASVTPVDAGPRQVSRRVVVEAAPAAVWEIVADPRRHPELDGSGTVRDAPVTAPDRLGEGDRFTVAMKQYGVPYSITSVVTALQPQRLVEWQHPMGHRWRWELEELGPDRTQVTETFDYRTAKAPRVLELLGQPTKNSAGITSTLQALAARFG